jgi:hypothetical protein
MRIKGTGLGMVGCAGGALLLVGILAIVPAISAQPQLSREAIERLRRMKPPEDWTTEERLAVRFNPVDVEKRDALGHCEVNHRRVGCNNIGGPQYGALFMPTELFSLFLGGAFQPGQAPKPERCLYDHQLRAAGLEPASFWPEMDRIATPELRAQADFRAPSRIRPDATRADLEAAGRKNHRLSISLCRAQVAAVAEARQRFGKRFERYLYREIAPTAFQTGSLGPSMEYLVSWREEGCPEQSAWSRVSLAIRVLLWHLQEMAGAR